MSTRATYNVKHNNKSLTFYIHHDGYPKGAANYLFQALDNYMGGVFETFNGKEYFSENKGSFIEAFLRGNINAEITGSHDSHADTDYKYSIDFNNKTVSIYDVNNEIHSKTDLFEFIHDLTGEFIHEYDNQYYTTNNLKRVLKQEEDLKSIWEQNGHMNSYNGKQLIERIDRLKDLLKLYV